MSQRKHMPTSMLRGPRSRQKSARVQSTGGHPMSQRKHMPCSNAPRTPSLPSRPNPPSPDRYLTPKGFTCRWTRRAFDFNSPRLRRCPIWYLTPKGFTCRGPRRALHLNTLRVKRSSSRVVVVHCSRPRPRDGREKGLRADKTRSVQ